MEFDLNWFIPALLGLIGGVVGSLVAPWVHWAIEKRRSKFEYRKSLIEKWRAEIDAFDWETENFGNTSTYAAMKPYMKSEVVEKFEAQRTYYVTPDGGRGKNLKKQWASDEVARIEKAWELT
ncbi:hypothetical protein [Rhodocaloribacter sp.]